MAKRKARKPSAAQLDRKRRVAWWHDGRFGMFVHWGIHVENTVDWWSNYDY